MALYFVVATSSGNAICSVSTNDNVITSDNAIYSVSTIFSCNAIATNSKDAICSNVATTIINTISSVNIIYKPQNY